MKQVLVWVVALLFSAPTYSLEPLGDTTGWSGFANLGVGGGEMSSNFLARIKVVEIDVGKERVDDFSEPSGKDFAAPLPAVSVGYTFKNKKTRIALGNDLSDFLQFDRTTEFLARHDFTGFGTLQLSYLNTAAVGTEVWADPYLLGTKRERTDFESSGGRITWDRIFGSGFELQASFIEREIDEEKSGEALGLSLEDRLLLNREGDVNRVELGYLARFGSGKHLLRPSVAIIDRDLDGRAMAQDGYGVGFTYGYTVKTFR